MERHTRRRDRVTRIILVLVLVLVLGDVALATAGALHQRQHGDHDQRQQEEVHDPILTGDEGETQGCRDGRRMHDIQDDEHDDGAHHGHRRRDVARVEQQLRPDAPGDRDDVGAHHDAQRVHAVAGVAIDEEGAGGQRGEQDLPVAQQLDEKTVPSTIRVGGTASKSSAHTPWRRRTDSASMFSPRPVATTPSPSAPIASPHR